MTRVLPTRAEIEQQLIAARAEVVACEDCDDTVGAELARCRCDDLTDQWAQT